MDADTVAGWRRATPSLDQLRAATADLRAGHPEVEVAVLADPSLKWALGAGEQDAWEEEIVARTVVCAPAGTIGGMDAWFDAVIARVRHDGDRALVVTDRALGGVPVVRLGRVGERFTFDLDGATEVTARPAPSWRRRSRR